MRITIIIITFILLFSGCINHPRNYKPAGYESWKEATPYVSNYKYYALKLSDAEWKAFYKEFPEYWKDIENARHIPLSGSIEYHPTYVAYAFRWTRIQRQQGWDQETRDRLQRKELVPGDSIFMIDAAHGPIDRLIWDNDFEILLYEPNLAISIENDAYASSTTLIKESVEYSRESRIIKELGLKRPKY